MRTPTLRAHSFSFGVTSAEAAWRDAEAFGPGALRLYFADTICEDEDTYRFGIQAAALVLGVPQADVADLTERARRLTPLEANDLLRRKRELRALAGEAIHRIPGLTWLQDGRTIWEVARDERWVNNSRACKATKLLKGAYLDAYMPENAVRVVGFDWSEEHRIHRIQRRLPGVTTAFPMAEPPELWKDQVIANWRARGIEPPRLYAVGFPHGNCGGGCARGGKTTWLLLYRWNRPRYLWHEGEELATQVHIGKPYTVLREIVNGRKRPLSLRAFRLRIEDGELFPVDEWGACGCAIGDDARAV
jgi:hypothetical protein